MASKTDNFQTNSRGLGNPGTWNPGSDGNSWSSQGGLYTLGLTGSSPHIFGTLTGLTTRVTEYYSSASQADGVLSVKFKVSNSSDGVGLVFRGDGTNANEYRCFYRGGNNTLEIAKVVSTNVTTLVSTSFTATAGTLYDIKCSFVGTALQGKIWKDTDSEPGYQVSATDATYSTGQFGLQIAAGANTDTVSVQYFSLIDSAVTKTRTISATASLTPTITRTVLAMAALQLSQKRTISPITAALQLTKTRTISSNTAALLIPGTRTISATAALNFAAGTLGISATAALQFVFARTLPTSGALLATASRTMSATTALSAQRTIPASSALSLADETRAIPASASLALYIALFPQTARRTGLFPASARRGVSSSDTP